MKKNNYYIQVTLGGIMLFIFTSISAQRCLELPECLLNPSVKVDIGTLLSHQKRIKYQPWIVYSDRGENFSKMYYVVEENTSQVHVFEASGHVKRRLLNPIDKGWISKTAFIMYFGAERSENSLIHRKCLTTISCYNVDGNWENQMEIYSHVLIYRSPHDTIPIGQLPRNSFFYIYKSEQGRFLLGFDYKLDTNQIARQIIGWVDKTRVFEIIGRIFFEPNFERQAVLMRLCHPDQTCKVFRFQEELQNVNDKKNRIKPAWEEPLWSYLPGVNRDSDSILIRSQLKEICMEENNGLLQLNIKPWAGNKLRFLFLGMEWGRERGTVRVAFIDQNSSSGQSGCFMSGYTCLKWSEDQYPLWKAEALFSQDEILSIISAIENFLTSNNSNNDASRVVNLWSNIFDKFVGGKLNYHAFLDFTPGQIMARLLGSTFEYETNDCIKKYTLRQILTNNQEVHECVKEYKFILAYHLNQLKDILFSKDLLFNVGERVYKNNNYSMYAKDSFWVPLECLP